MPCDPNTANEQLKRLRAMEVSKNSAESEKKDKELQAARLGEDQKDLTSRYEAVGKAVEAYAKALDPGSDKGYVARHKALGEYHAREIEMVKCALGPDERKRVTDIVAKFAKEETDDAADVAAKRAAFQGEKKVDAPGAQDLLEVAIGGPDGVEKAVAAFDALIAYGPSVGATLAALEKLQQEIMAKDDVQETYLMYYLLLRFEQQRQSYVDLKDPEAWRTELVTAWTKVADAKDKVRGLQASADKAKKDLESSITTSEERAGTRADRALQEAGALKAPPAAAAVAP